MEPDGSKSALALLHPAELAGYREASQVSLILGADRQEKSLPSYV